MEVKVYSDFIVHFKELLSPTVCRQIIEQYDQDPAKRSGRVHDGAGKLTVNSLNISSELTIFPEGPWKSTHQEIDRQVYGAIAQVMKHFHPLQVDPLVARSDYKIKRYEKKAGHFKWHFDAFGPGGWSRQLAMILYLNDVEEGGETCFFFQKLKMKPLAGHALFFPPFWTHYHCGLVPESGNKYIITAFVGRPPT